MKTIGYTLVEGQNIRDLTRSYNRDRSRLENFIWKLGKTRLTALKQGRIKKEGFNIVYGSLKSERGNWSYDVIIKVVPEKGGIVFNTFSIIDDPIRSNKKEVILWDITMRGKIDNTRIPIIIKQHALERYYQRARGEDFPGIKEATYEILLHELPISFSSDSIRTITVSEDSVSLSTRSGLFLAYTRQTGKLDQVNPTIFNTFISHREIDERQKSDQIKNRLIQDRLEKCPLETLINV